VTSTDLVAQDEIEVVAPAPANLFRTDQPTEIIARATDTANALMQAVRKQKLTANIQGKEYPLVEAWTLCGTMLGVFPVCVWTRKLEDGFEARVEARTLAGQVVGAAEAQCTRTERTWKSRDDYALRSMAQTRATSKALRQPLGFVMTLAGLQATPAEEMPRDGIEPAEIVDPDGQVFPDQRPVDEPSPFTPPAGAIEERPKGTVSEAQRKNIYRLLKKLVETGEWSEETLKGELYLAYGVKSTTELTKAEASSVIDGWKKRAGEDA
jgi:hypothetical protein